MSQKTRPDQPTDKNPAHQADEDAGNIKSAQKTEANMRKKDLPRGSAPETRGKSSQR